MYGGMKSFRTKEISQYDAVANIRVMRSSPIGGKLLPLVTKATTCKVHLTCLPFTEQYNSRTNSNTDFQSAFDIKEPHELQTQWWDILQDYATNFKFQRADEWGTGPLFEELRQETVKNWSFIKPESAQVMKYLFREYMKKLEELVGSQVGATNEYWCQILDGTTSPRVLVIGDLHSSPRSFSRILLHNKDMFVDNLLQLKPNHKIVFTGDIVDRGPFGFQIFSLVACLVLANWTPSGGNVVVCNGNHEDCDVFTRYGLDHEIKLYGEQVSCKIDSGVIGESNIAKFLDYLPTCCILKTIPGLILFTHGACPYANEEFNEKAKSLDGVNFFTFDDEVKVTKWGDWTSVVLDTAAVNPRRGVVVPYNVGLAWMKRNGFIQVITGHQDLAGYGCYTLPPNNPEKYMDPTDRNNPYNKMPTLAYVLKPHNGTLDVTDNNIHTLSSAIYPKYDEYSLSSHNFITVTFA